MNIALGSSQLSFFVEGGSGGTRVIQKIYVAKRRSDAAADDAAIENGAEVDHDDDVHDGKERDVEDDDEDGDASPSFYVADDEKSIAIVDLLLESKDKT